MSAPSIDDRKMLTREVLFITHQLGLYQAELARVLHVQCADIGRLGTGKVWLDPGTEAWRQAVRFVDFYRRLHDKLQGDDVSMYHWLRADNPYLGGVPLLLIVDDDRLSEVIDILDSDIELKRVSGRGGA